MKRQSSGPPSARRHEAANLALKGWAQAAIAKRLQIPQGTVSRDLAALAAEHERDPVLHKLRRKASEQENPTAPAGAQGAPAGQDGIGQDDVGQNKEQEPQQVIHALNCHFDALKGPLCASARIMVGSFVSHSCIRAFSDFQANAGADMKFENDVRGTTQVIARQLVTARSVGSR